MSDEQSSEPGQRPEELLLRNEVISGALLEFHERELRDREASGVTGPIVMPVVIELNLQNALGLAGARSRLDSVWREVIGRPPPALISDIYCLDDLTLEQVQALVREDMTSTLPAARAIYRIWPDFEVGPLIDKSCSTVKADAARRSYDAAGRGIVWAVIDSGIDKNHPHFKQYATLAGDVENLHKDFTKTGDALADGFGHGTHVAGIIAGGLDAGTNPRVTQEVQDPMDPKKATPQQRDVADPRLLAGIAPHTKLVSLKVLDDAGTGSSMNVVRALEYVRCLLYTSPSPRD